MAKTASNASWLAGYQLLTSSITRHFYHHLVAFPQRLVCLSMKAFEMAEDPFPVAFNPDDEFPITSGGFDLGAMGVH
jgi:hypothetical protein